MPNSNFMSDANATAIFTAYATAIKLGLKAWVGTTAEWDQLTDAQKKQYQVNFKTDDCSEESIEVVKRSIADDFSISVNYAVGEYCYHLGDLYKFTSAHTAGAWSSADVEQVQVCDELSELKNTLNNMNNMQSITLGKATTAVSTVYTQNCSYNKGTKIIYISIIFETSSVIATETEILGFSMSNYAFDGRFDTFTNSGNKVYCPNESRYIKTNESLPAGTHVLNFVAKIKTSI